MIIFTVCAVAQTVTGRWIGKLDTGAGILRIFFNNIQTDGKPVCTMESLDQGAFGIKVGITLTDEIIVIIDIPGIGFTYNGDVKDDLMKGTLTQNGFNFPLELKPEQKKLNHPQTPLPPYPYATEEVTFTNPDDSATLSGTLPLPVDYENAKKKNLPVVVMATGSGLQNRDEELFNHKPFLVIADFLARNGIV